MGYSKGDFVRVSDQGALYILMAFHGDQVELLHAIMPDHYRTFPFGQLVKATSRARNLTPFQRGLLRAIKYSSIPAWMYRHMRPSTKRSVNCLIRKGFVELFDDTEFAPNGTEVNGQGVRVTWAGRRVDTSD